MADGELQMWTVYERPLDYPGGFVVRRSWVVRGNIVQDKVAQYASSLVTARGLIPEGLYCIGRQPGDDPVIVEVWV